MLQYIDDEQDVEALCRYISESDKVVAIPITADFRKHYAVNEAIGLYLWVSDTDNEYCISSTHPDTYNVSLTPILQSLKTTRTYVLDRNEWIQLFNDSDVIDMQLLYWWVFNDFFDTAQHLTPAHQFYYFRHMNLKSINSIVPLVKSIEYCSNLTALLKPLVKNVPLDAAFMEYNDVYLEVFRKIELNGLRVMGFPKKGLVHNGYVYSKYNMYTSTGRPSNRWGGYNFSAIPKGDDSRDVFISRHQNGKLFEFDFDAYHLRIMAKIVGYEMPAESMHTYLGKYYFDKETLTSEEYEQSKKITFSLMYGGITEEYMHIPFYQEVAALQDALWKEWQQNGYIVTPISKRKISKDVVGKMRKTKLFNYYIQASETEISVVKLTKLHALLENKNTKLILYTYDSFLFDVDTEEGPEIIRDIKSILTRGGFPVKSSLGDIYSKMKEVTIPEDDKG